MTALVAWLGGTIAARTVEVGGWRWSDLPAGWVLTLVAVGLWVLARTLYKGERGRATPAARVMLALLRAGMLFLILLLLAGPYREEVRISEERSHLVVLVDASGSMDERDRYDAASDERLRVALWPEGRGAPAANQPLDISRLDVLKGVLAPDGESLLRRLNERFVLHVFAFAGDWWSLGATRSRMPGEEGEAEDADPIADIGQAIRELGDASARRDGTNLGAVLRSVAGEYLGREDRPLAGVLLLSDGRDTNADETPLDVLAALGNTSGDLHVTPIAMGHQSTGSNVRMERIRALDEVLIGDDVVFETAIRHTGFAGQRYVGARMRIERVADENGEALEEPEPYDPGERGLLTLDGLTLGEESEPTPVHLQARMNEPGTFRVTISVELPPEALASDAIRTDNEATHEISVRDQRIKVLLVDNEPRYELRFLGNLLTREPKVDPTRPEVRRRYRTHVLQQTASKAVDQLASPGMEPLRDFPSTRRELFDYDVIILGDVAWEGLAETTAESRKLLELIRDFVREGGGLALVAGAGNRNPLELRDTPLQDLLPISPRKNDQTASDSVNVPFRLQLTDAGLRHPAFGVVYGQEQRVATREDVLETWRGERALSTEWEWHWLYRATGGLSPGAVELATATLPGKPLTPAFLDASGRPLVVFATLNFGKGRVFFSALDAIYRIRKGLGDTIYGPFWDQVVRYLATYRLLGGNKRFKISTDKSSYFVGETATVTITALDRDFEPMMDAWLEGVHIEDPSGVDRELEGDFRPANQAIDGAAPGTYGMLLPVREQGTYRVWIDDSAGAAARGGGGRAERRFDALFATAERQQPMPDHPMLTRIASETGGRLIDGRTARPEELGRIAEELPARTARRVLDRKAHTLWDRAWVLLLLVGLMGLEWALRKRYQMI